MNIAPKDISSPWAKLENLNTAYNFEKTFMISAQKDQGITNLKKWMAENLPRANWLYPQNQLADFQIKSFAVTINARSACCNGAAKPPHTTSPKTSNITTSVLSSMWFCLSNFTVCPTT